MQSNKQTMKHPNTTTVSNGNDSFPKIQSLYCTFPQIYTSLIFNITLFMCNMIHVL